MNSFSQPIESSIDANEWKLEVERVTPLLKISLPNHKDWRIHLQQMDYHQKAIQESMNSSQTQLDKIHDDVVQTLEQISSREKYINSQFESLVNWFNLDWTL